MCLCLVERAPVRPSQQAVYEFGFADQEIQVHDQDVDSFANAND